MIIIELETCDFCDTQLEEKRVDEAYGEFCSKKCRDNYVAELQEQLVAA
jgi:endogenous inhibitor of DNA gyrase (YacG/DUF329 family)